MLELRSLYEHDAMERDREEALTLEILQAIDGQSDVTQRHLADRMGIALGLTNSYLRRCVRKGLVKVTQAPANRYLYYLTPKGFAEKARLTAEYFASSFDYYNRAGRSVSNALQQIELNEQRRVLFAGVSELAEIASVRAHEFDISIVGTFDLNSSARSLAGRPVWRRLSDVAEYDAVLYTDISATRDNYEALKPAREAALLYLPDIIDFGLERAVD